jgi:hypothetical protein
MKGLPDVTPRADLMARLVCAALGVFLGAVCATAYFAASHAAVWWLSGIGSAVFLFASVGPQSFRVGLLMWLPWV